MWQNVQISHPSIQTKENTQSQPPAAGSYPKGLPTRHTPKQSVPPPFTLPIHHLGGGRKCSPASVEINQNLNRIIHKLMIVTPTLSQSHILVQSLSLHGSRIFGSDRTPEGIPIPLGRAPLQLLLQWPKNVPYYQSRILVSWGANTRKYQNSPYCCSYWCKHRFLIIWVYINKVYRLILKYINLLMMHIELGKRCGDGQQI